MSNSTRIRTVGGQVASYPPDMSSKGSLEDIGHSWADNDLNSNIYFDGKGRYSLSESTWEPEESMFDPPFMIDKFRMDALEEGIDIDKEKTALILLRVAKDPCVPKAT
ncbi:hypothetical protein BYT27DRAFT_6958368 [Phlegmacium glaucopus]|nr:hypothetical protein BYT27DRAFT_6958368 [Phlegmacium glaucopus]